MQRVEVKDTADLKIHCPFCGAVAITPDGINQCEHTLFLASDDGFEFVSPKLNFDKEVDMGEMNLDEFTDAIDFPEAIKFAIYQPAPSFFGGYVAFAPL